MTKGRATVLVVNGRPWLACLFLGVLGVACSSDAGEEVPGTGGMTASGPRRCTVEAPTKCVEPMPVYADVAPIFEARCFACHGGLPGQTEWPLTTYAHVASWQGSLLGVLASCAMPPESSGLELPEAESLVILNWVRCGMPLNRPQG